MHIKESVRGSFRTIPRHHFASAPFAARLAVMYDAVNPRADHSRPPTKKDFAPRIRRNLIFRSFSEGTEPNNRILNR